MVSYFGAQYFIFKFIVELWIITKTGADTFIRFSLIGGFTPVSEITLGLDEIFEEIKHCKFEEHQCVWVRLR